MDYDFKKPVVSYFEGIEGVRYVLNECLNVEEEFRVYLPLKRLFEYGLKEFFLKIGKRVLDKEVLLKIIVLDSPEVREFFDKNFDLEDENIQILILSDSKDMALFECGMCIFDEKVALMHFDGQDEYGVLIQSREIANMHKNVFDVSWNGFKMDGKK
jgi:sugar-specific transcriptional regulator TrmB